MTIEQRVAVSTGVSERQVFAVLKLLGEGATIPFISRYRKEATGALNEVQIADIEKVNDTLNELLKRKETVLGTIEEQGKLTDELRRRVEDCWNTTELEDIYLPYKPKRRTRAEIARQKGLEVLALTVLLQRDNNIHQMAKRFVKGEVKSEEDALKGACDIIAEQVNEDEKSRNAVRSEFTRGAVITSVKVKGKENEADKYRDYFDFSEPLKRCTSHRLLAIRRGEAEGMLSVSVSPDDEQCVERLLRQYVRGNNESSRLVGDAVKDAYKRLLKPSIENEFAVLSKQKADEEAIRVFAENLRQLLLAPPLGQKRVMGIDPGFRTGCKVVCLDAQGNLLHNEAIYPHPPQNERAQALRKLSQFIEMYKIEAISIGNGTAGRETEDLVSQLKTSHSVEIFVVSEDGASVYSASKTAREEFPDYDVTVRGAVSIGRRLMDPLAELVKIDPKSIGVGQYQHDVDQTRLKKQLDQTVESCVNSVGVNLNTASRHLLLYVSGLGPQLASNIVEYRKANGPFISRAQLKKVPRLGTMAFQQCAGFLRIPEAKNPLDATAVHPESYLVVEQMAKDLNCKVRDLIANKELRDKIDLKHYITSETGLPTLTDIMKELEKPGLDPRGLAEVFSFDPDVRTMEDLHEGMVLNGIVSNITNFGAFVDIGVHEKGLVHISQLADKYISDPTTIVSLHQHLRVKVLSVDQSRKRISLTLIGVDQI